MHTRKNTHEKKNCPGKTATCAVFVPFGVSCQTPRNASPGGQWAPSWPSPPRQDVSAATHLCVCFQTLHCCGSTTIHFTSLFVSQECSLAVYILYTQRFFCRTDNTLLNVCLFSSKKNEKLFKYYSKLSIEKNSASQQRRSWLIICTQHTTTYAKTEPCFKTANNQTPLFDKLNLDSLGLCVKQPIHLLLYLFGFCLFVCVLGWRTFLQSFLKSLQTILLSDDKQVWVVT